MFGFSQVARLQEQLQAERDLRAALEIGLNMSAAQLSAAQTFDSKVCIALMLAVEWQTRWQRDYKFLLGILIGIQFFLPGLCFVA